MKSEKVTSSAERWYDDACCVAHGLEILGERWALLVVRELMLGPRRFIDLKHALPGISANVLTQRLEGLETAGVIERGRLPPPSNVQVYGLTPCGYEAEPVIQVLSRWACRSPGHDPTLPMSAASMMLSFRTMISAERAAGLAATVGFRFGRDGFVARIVAGGITIERGDPATAEAAFETDPATMVSLVYGGRTIVDAESAGAVTVSGDRALAERFVGLFALRRKAPIPLRAATAARL